jgi:signal transduction histidine kinase
LAKNKRLELRHDQNFVSFRLAATDYTNPAQNQYAYRLEGSDNQWIELGRQPDVNFANLSDGSYTLRLKSANNQGVWNDKDNFSLPLIVHPPWWRTGWFYGLGLLFLLGLVWSIYTLRINQLLALERAKNEENERVRQMAAQDIHDEFGNSLTRISLLSELVKNQIKKEKPAEALNLLAKISDNSQRLYQGTKDFIWAINTDHDNLYEVAIRIKDYCEEVLDKNQIRFDCDGIGQHLIEKKLAAGTSRQVVMIFKEATTNTLKHAQATTVKLYFETEGPRIYIVWQDNGQGITTAKTNGQGIENMHTRAAKIKADFRIESNLHRGTTVKLGI